MVLTEALDAVYEEREEAEAAKLQEARRVYLTALRNQREGYPASLADAERLIEAFDILKTNRVAFREDLNLLARRDEAKQVLSDALVTCPTSEEVQATNEASIAAQNLRCVNRAHAYEMADKVRVINDKLEAFTAAREHLRLLERNHAALYEEYDALTQEPVCV